MRFCCDNTIYHKQSPVKLLLRIKFLMAVNEVVKGFYFMLFEVIPELRGRSGIYADGILLFNRTHECIVTFAAQFTVFVSGTNSLHARCVFCHIINYFIVGLGRKSRLLLPGFLY